jgi:DNA polymerase V
VRQLLTRTGGALWWVLNGEQVLPIQPQRPAHQTLSRGGSMGGVITEPAKLWAWAVRNLERLIEELEFHEVGAGRLTVYIGYRDQPTGAGEYDFNCPTDRFDLLLDAARAALRQAYRPGAPATHMHLIASRLRRAGFIQRSPFEPPAQQAEAVARVKRQVNESVGRFALRSAATLPLTELYRDPANAYEICDIRGKLCF